MSLSHKKVFKEIASTYGFEYYKWLGWHEPVNVIYFYYPGEPNGRHVLQIEIIPKSKTTPTPTIYVQLTRSLPRNQEETLLSHIERLYTEQTKESSEEKYAIGFNTNRPFKYF